jgi:hypothetical protein
MRLLSGLLVALLVFAPRAQFVLAGDDLPCSCLQELWVDNPGPYDLYIALNHVTSCNEQPQEVLWYGWPSNSTLPQQCGYTACEEYQEPNGPSVASFPGHGQELVGLKAWEVVRVGLESAIRKSPGLEFGTPSYHIIPGKSLPEKLKATRDMVVMAIPMSVHVKTSRFDGNKYYLCVQVESTNGLPISKATFEDVKLGTGSQLLVKFRTRTGEVRKGLVWLK